MEETMTVHLKYCGIPTVLVCCFCECSLCTTIDNINYSQFILSMVQFMIIRVAIIVS